MNNIYLNDSSTDAIETGVFNHSDIAYPDIIEERRQLNDIKLLIKRLVNAPYTAEVIFNSGATESIANCVFWASNKNKYGKVLGTSHDHDSLRKNCELYKMDYIQNLDYDGEASMYFLTHVDGSTGEILDVSSICKSLQHINVINTFSFMDNYRQAREFQYKPLIVVDISQSILKIPIEMDKWNVDAVFFSLHKIGGEMGLGVLIIKDVSNYVPLIAGSQQNSLRGGTLPLHIITESVIFNNANSTILKGGSLTNSQKNIWKTIYKKLKQSNLDVYTPKCNHLYNTFLINTHGCPLNTIYELSLKGIYVGTKSACANEEPTNDKNNYIRLSFNLQHISIDDVLKAVDVIIETLTYNKQYPMKL